VLLILLQGGFLGVCIDNSVLGCGYYNGKNVVWVSSPEPHSVLEMIDAVVCLVDPKKTWPVLKCSKALAV
jgi:hypothetical protein